MHNLGTVFRFEVVRTLKKKSFWIMALSFPVVISAIFAIIYFSGQASDKASEEAKNQQFSIEVLDESNLISEPLLKQVGAKTASSAAASIAKVKDGKLDAFIHYPKDLTRSKTETYAKNVSMFDNNRYDAMAKFLLEKSVSNQTKPEIAAILKQEVAFTTTTYKNGAVFNPIMEMILPGVFLVMFYVLIAMFGNQMLTSTTEEKENRVIEMLLTTIQARTLIIGKMLSLVVLAAIQVSIILVPIAIAFIFLRDELALPSIDLANIPVDGVRIAISAVLFSLSFLFFMGLLIAIGAAAPTAKDAGSFFGVIMILIFGPLYAFPLFISSPESTIVTFLSFFPFTAPIPLLLRNAVGNLSAPDAMIAIVILSISAVLALMVAIRLFRFGALEYSKRLSLKAIFNK